MQLSRESNLELKNLIYTAFQTIINSSDDMVFVKDANLVYVAASEGFAKMTGKKSAENIVGRTDFDIFEDADLAQRYVADDRKLFQGEKNLINYIEPIADDNGKARYGSTSKYILHDSNGEISGVLGITKDVTRDYLIRQHHQQELQYMFDLPQDIYAVSYIDIDDWRIISQRSRVLNGTKIPPCNTVDEFCEITVSSILDRENEAVQFYENFTQDKLKEFFESGKSRQTFTYKRRMAEGVSCWIISEARFWVDVDSGHLCVMLSARDVNEEKTAQQHLVEAARMDKMTMLLNRETTMNNICRILESEAESNHALFMIDVDNFKHLNDTLGHQAGDEFLIDLAMQIKKCFRESDVVGRIGGDEFFALMRNVPDRKTVENKAEDLLSAIQKLCKNYSDIPLSASIGISLYTANDRTLEELYGGADGALYEAKRKGKNQFVFDSVQKKS